MMLLASISWFGLLVLIAGGWLALRLVNPRRSGSLCGGLKLLGIAAIVAGVAVFWVRPGRHVQVDYPHAAPITVVDHGVVVEHYRSDDEFVPVGQLAQEAIRNDGVPKWVLISLGSGLIILGALMFGRGGNRPVAFKAATLLGIGAILYAVVTYLGQAPSRSSQSRTVSMVRVDKRDMPRITRHEDRAGRRHSHAKRPTLHPARSTDDEVPSIEELPPRAGEIPVSAELDRQASNAGSKEKSTRGPAAEPTPASPPAPAPEPAPAPPAGEAKPAPADTVARPDAAKAPAAPEPEGEAPKQPAPATPPAEPPKVAKAPEPPKPADARPAVEPSKPIAQPKIEPAKPVESKPAATESPDEEDVNVGNEPRPDWVDSLPGLTGGVYSMSVRSGRFVTLPECQRELDRQIKSEADHYINEYLGDDAAALVDIPLSYLKDRVKKAEYVEIVNSQKLADLNLGHMYEIHARLEFDDQARADFRRQWHNAEVVNRLWYTGGAAALVLALLATLYGYLKLDLRTGGAHKGRLQLAATLVALIAAASVLLVRWAVPF